MSREACCPRVGVAKLYMDAKIPIRMTQKSACYDVFCYLKEGTEVVYYDGYDAKHSLVIGNSELLTVMPFCRYLIPTGCKFDIPDELSIRIHPRSGNALKRGLSLPNCEGVIDCDYPEQTFVLLANNSFVTKFIPHGERLCQLELVDVKEIDFYEVDDFGQKTDRVSGLGSTG